MSVDPRRTSPFCEPRCYRECRCSRWPDYKNRFGEYVVPHDDEDAWTPALPLPVSGLLPEHWYRSDGPLWQDAGINPAVNDGDVVGRWEDITANNDHVNQANAGNKPTLQNGAGDLLNGHPVVRADGINDYLVGAFTTGGAMNQPNTIFAVAQTTPTFNRGLLDGDDAVNRSQLVIANALNWRIYAGVNLNGGAPDINWHIWSVLFNGAASQFWKDGISEGGPANAGALMIDGATLLAAIGGVWPWFGDATEFIYYDADIPNADKNTVGQYLATRYALAYADI